MAKQSSEIALRAAMDARIPTMLVGHPGTTKTAKMNALADEMGYKLITVILSQKENTDISGFPSRGVYHYNDEDHLVTEYAPQIWQLEVMFHEKVILFFDEFSNAHPSVRASFLTLIQDRKFPNGDEFPADTIIVGAMNPIDSAPDGHELDPATTNRMMFLAWDPDPNEWLEGMPDRWGRGVKSENEKTWRDYIVRFIRDNLGSLHHANNEIGSTETYGVDPNDSAQRTVLQYSWASRRSWDNLACVLGSLYDSGRTNDTNTEDEIMSGLIGFAEAHRFRKWLQENSKLNVAGIIENPKSFKGWKNITQEDANLILSAAVDSINVENASNVLMIFKIFAKVDRASLSAGYLNDTMKKINPLKRNMSADEHKDLVKDAMSVMKMYSSIIESGRTKRSSQ